MNGKGVPAAIFVFSLLAMRSERALGAPEPSIWFRSAEGCPDGTGFLERLETRGVHARIAVVGDPIDFVVTLGTAPEGASGLLERQTKNGTVAIRRLDGSSCDEVADGLALSLSVAGTPDEQQPKEPTRATIATPGAPSASNGRNAAADVAPSAPPSAGVDERRTHVAVGVEGAILSGATPGVLPGASIVFDVAPIARGILSRTMFRAAALGYTAGFSTPVRDYHVWLAGGRMQGCPTWFGSESSVRVRPCVAVDLGTLQTAGSGSDGSVAGALWASGSLAAQLDFRVTRGFGLEGGLEVTFPFTRYEIAAARPDTALYRTAPAGFRAALGTYLVLK